MYIETVPNRNSPPAILLREGWREGSKTRKRTLANLSHWNPARVEALRRALRGEFDHLLDPHPQLGLCFGNEERTSPGSGPFTLVGYHSGGALSRDIVSTYLTQDFFN